MDDLPQGQPTDYRAIIAQLSSDALRGGPPASALGPDPKDFRYHPLGLPLPNFPDLDPDDDLPCHIGKDTLREHYEAREIAAGQPDGPIDLEGATRDYDALKAATRVHYYASQQPLTVKPTPDGSNLYSALPGTVEHDFIDAFTWYKRWLEWLHYVRVNRPRVDRARRLIGVIKGWLREQELFGDEPSAINGLYAVPPPIQPWLWAWHFWLVWEMRRRLKAVANPGDRDFTIDMLDDLLDTEELIDDTLERAGWPQDRFMEVEFQPGAFRDEAEREAFAREMDLCQVAQRKYFKIRALRKWTFGRPWKKIWLVMDDDPESELAYEKVNELQQYLHQDVYGSMLLGVHPILPSQLRDKTEGCLVGGTESCADRSWGAHDMVIETWCGHVVCFQCFTKYWSRHMDNVDAGRISNALRLGDWPCLVCRQSAGRLRSRLEIAQVETFGAEGDRIADTIPLNITIDPLPPTR